MVKKKLNSQKSTIRTKIWSQLYQYARPDSRFHWDFNQFIPDFDGSQICADRIREMNWYKESRIIFITPDNCLEFLRRYAIHDKKQILTTTYGINRGFLHLDPDEVVKGQEWLASTLDGIEYFARSVDLQEIKAIGQIGLLVTGASIVTLRGVRWGKGHGYFDLEWGVLRELGIVDENSPIIAVGHDCQIIDIEVEISPFDTIVDRIVTPKKVINVVNQYQKPLGIFWDYLKPDLLETIPILQEFNNEQGEH